MFRVLTVAREYGSGGGLVAQRVADELGWDLVDRVLVWDIARAACVDAQTVRQYDEHVDSGWRRFHRKGLWAAAIAAGIPVADAQILDAETMAALARRAIVDAAESGNCVIVGRGGECVLQDRKDVFHVFIYGPWRERLARVRDRLDPAEDAEKVLYEKDQERARYLRTYYGCDWKDPHLYNMMISSQIGVETAASIIAHAVREGCAMSIDASCGRSA